MLSPKKVLGSVLAVVTAFSLSAVPTFAQSYSSATEAQSDVKFEVIQDIPVGVVTDPNDNDTQIYVDTNPDGDPANNPGVELAILYVSDFDFGQDTKDQIDAQANVYQSLPDLAPTLIDIGGPTVNPIVTPQEQEDPFISIVDARFDRSSGWKLQAKVSNIDFDAINAGGAEITLKPQQESTSVMGSLNQYILPGAAGVTLSAAYGDVFEQPDDGPSGWWSTKLNPELAVPMGVLSVKIHNATVDWQLLVTP